MTEKVEQFDFYRKLSAEALGNSRKVRSLSPDIKDQTVTVVASTLLTLQEATLGRWNRLRWQTEKGGTSVINVVSPEGVLETRVGVNSLLGPDIQDILVNAGLSPTTLHRSIKKAIFMLQSGITSIEKLEER